jgi:hypothetical protein
VAALFRTRSEAEEGLRKLKEAGFAEDEVSVATARVARPQRYAAKVAGGVVVGTVVGAIVGAVVAGMMPGIHAMIPGNALATFVFVAVAGGATGGVAGALLSVAASGDTALYYDEEVESGRALVSVTGPRVAVARALLLRAGAMEAAPLEAPLHERRRRHRAEGG